MQGTGRIEEWAARDRLNDMSGSKTNKKKAKS
jgi:hypothetical protein